MNTRLYHNFNTKKELGTKFTKTFPYKAKMKDHISPPFLNISNSSKRFCLRYVFVTAVQSKLDIKCQLDKIIKKQIS